MKINLTTQYLADFRTLSQEEQSAVAAVVDLFIEDPFHISLDNHALEGCMKGAGRSPLPMIYDSYFEPRPIT